MKNKYSGMTVNEQLYVSGLINEFDKAVKKKDIERIITILRKVDLTDEATINILLRQIGL